MHNKSADEPFDERMGQWNVWDGLYFCHFQYPQVGLPLVKVIKRIVVGAEVFRQRALTSNGAVEHPTKCDTIDRARLDAEPDDPARVLIHDDQDPVGPQRGRLACEQIHTPETVFQVAQESQPRRTAGVLSRPVVIGENPSNNVFVDLDVERQGDLLGDARTTPIGITLLHLDDRMNEFYPRSFRAGLPTAFRGEQRAVLSLAYGFVKAQQCRGLQYDCGPEQTSWTDQEHHPPGKRAVPRGEIGRSSPGAIHDQELVPEEKRLRNDGTETARSKQADERSKEMDEKNHQTAHRTMVARWGILRNHGRNNNSPATRATRLRFGYPLD